MKNHSDTKCGHQNRDGTRCGMFPKDHSITGIAHGFVMTNRRDNSAEDAKAVMVAALLES